LSSNATRTEIDNEPIFWIYFLIKAEVSTYTMVMIIEHR